MCWGILTHHELISAVLLQTYRFASKLTIGFVNRFSLEGGDLEPEWERRLERFANAVVRGAGTGFCLRGGLNMVRGQHS